MYNPGYLTRNATGGWTLTAVGTNQSITLTPSGTGSTIFGAGGFPTLTGGLGAAYGSATGGVVFTGNGSTSDITLVGASGSGALVIPHNSQNVLLGGLTTNGTGVLQFPAATTSAGGITFGTDVNLFRDTVGGLQQLSSGSTTTRFRLVNNNGNASVFSRTGTSTIISSDDGSVILASNNVTALTLDSSQNATFAKKIVSYNGVSTTGLGTPSIVATGRFTAQSAAGNITNGSYTVGAADGTFEVSGNINVISAVAVSTSLNVTYTDETNTSRTMILPLSGLAGSFVAAGLATTTGPFESAVMHIRCKASTAITFAVAAGTFTTVSYNAECTIKQTA